jgi:RNA polymerase sigma-54 factor
MLKQSQQQKLFQRLSPQQIRVMKLLEVTSVSLDQRIKEELEENPALEMGSDQQSDDTYQLDNEEDPYGSGTDEEVSLTEGEGEDMDLDSFLKMEDDYDGDYDYKNGEESTKEPVMNHISFHDFLIEQLRMMDLDKRRNTIAEHIIGNIDDDGFLRREVPAIIDDLAFSQNIQATPEEVKELITIIHDFDPAGVGAWTLEESLLLQLKRLKPVTKDIRTARNIIARHFSDLINKYYQRIRKTLDLSEEEFRSALAVISRLTPKPGASFGSVNKGETYVVPDFYVYDNNGKLEVSLNALNAPDLRISEGYMDMMKAYERSDKKNKDQRDAVHFIKQKLEGAKWFIDAIRQRQHTMMQTMQTIVDMQQRFFQTGDESTLRPMVLKDVAAATGLDISTISRVSNSKYVQTEYGTFRLKFFFSESLQNDSGEEVSSREVKVLLNDLVSAEDKQSPLTDDQLKDLLAEKGFNIARRTIAKYREMLDIPVARLRREI